MLWQEAFLLIAIGPSMRPVVWLAHTLLALQALQLDCFLCLRRHIQRQAGYIGLQMTDEEQSVTSHAQYFVLLMVH